MLDCVRCRFQPAQPTKELTDVALADTAAVGCGSMGHGCRSAGKAAGKLGLALVALGIGMLLLGIIYHISFMLQVRAEREKLEKGHNIMPQDTFPISLTLIIAVLLLLLGIYVIFKMIINY